MIGTWIELSRRDALVAAAGLEALLEITDGLAQLGVAPLRNRPELERIVAVLKDEERARA